MDNLNKNQNALPKEVDAFLSSMKGAKLNVLISDKYKLEGEKIRALLLLIDKLFFKELKLASLVLEIKNIFNFDEKKAKEMAGDIAGLRLFPIADWLGENVANYISSLGGNPDNYIKYIDEQKKALKEEEEYFKVQLAPRPEIDETKFSFLVHSQEEEKEESEEFDWKKEKEGSVNLFSKNIVGILKSAESAVLDEYNLVLIKLLLENGAAYETELERGFMANSEVITAKPFTLDGRPEQGTVANWLKYFIKLNGSAIFDIIILAKFLAEAKNCKALDAGEKELLKKVLITYRNLKFFPESMPNEDGDGWQIIPFEEEGEKEERKPINIRPEMLRAPAKKSEAIRPFIAVPPVKPEPVRPFMPVPKKELSEDDKKILELKEMLRQYPEGSFEALAIKEEIDSLEK